MFKYKNMSTSEFAKASLSTGVLKQPIEEGLIKLSFKGSWLDVEYKNNKSADGKDFNYKLLCAQNIGKMTTKEIEERVVVMLAENLRSVNQDYNILASKKLD